MTSMTYRIWAGSSETEEVMCGLLITIWGRACLKTFLCPLQK